MPGWDWLWAAEAEPWQCLTVLRYLSPLPTYLLPCVMLNPDLGRAVESMKRLVDPDARRGRYMDTRWAAIGHPSEWGTPWNRRRSTKDLLHENK